MTSSTLVAAVKAHPKPALLLVLAALLGVLIALPGTASAAWNASGSGSATGKGLGMPAGNTPSAVVSGRNVTVTWAQSNFSTGSAVSGYDVKRYDTGGTAQTIGSACSTTVSGLTCTEAAVPAGTWTYSVVPRQSNWAGAESSRSSSVTVASPSLTFTSSTTVSSPPATLSGSIANFVTGQTVTFRLDDPSTGTVLTGSTTPGSIPANGSATISVTIPSYTSDGAHTVYAVDSAGDSASAAISVHVPHTVVTPAFDLRDASAGGAAANASSQAAFGGDLLYYLSGTAWPTTFSATKYLQFDMYPAAPAAASASNVSFTFSFAPVSGTGCFYFDVRRISTGAVLATHGSSGSPVACSSNNAAFQSTTTSLPEVTTTDIANDLRIRVYETNSPAALSATDQATVTGTQNSTAFTLYSTPLTDVSSGTPVASPWSLAASGDGAFYTTPTTSWNTTFSATRYLKFSFPAYVPSAATGVSATFKHTYSSNTAGTLTSVYYEVYSGATLIGSHGSSGTPYSSTTSTVTDTISMPEVNSVAAANNLSVRIYAKNNNGTASSRRSRHDVATVTLNYTG